MVATAVASKTKCQAKVSNQDVEELYRGDQGGVQVVCGLYGLFSTKIIRTLLFSKPRRCPRPTTPQHLPQKHLSFLLSQSPEKVVRAHPFEGSKDSKPSNREFRIVEQAP